MTKATGGRPAKGPKLQTRVSTATANAIDEIASRARVDRSTLTAFLIEHAISCIELDLTKIAKGK